MIHLNGRQGNTVRSCASRILSNCWRRNAPGRSAARCYGAISVGGRNTIGGGVPRDDGIAGGEITYGDDDGRGADRSGSAWRRTRGCDGGKRPVDGGGGGGGGPDRGRTTALSSWNSSCRRRWLSSCALATDDDEAYSAYVEEAGDGDYGEDDDAAAAKSPPSFFDLLGAPRSFAIDEDELKISYRKIMTECHPDKYACASLLPGSGCPVSEAERAEREERASAVTHAYGALRDPHARAVHLLEIMGHPVDETSQTDDLGSEGFEFLIQVMSIREAIESIDRGDDESLRPLLVENRGRVEETCRQLGDAFGGAAAVVGDGNEIADVARIVALTAKLRYWNRIDESIREKMDEYE